MSRTTFDLKAKKTKKARKRLQEEMGEGRGEYDDIKCGRD